MLVVVWENNVVCLLMLVILLVLLIFQLIHFDVWEKASVSTKGGAQYYVVFVDDFSRYCWIYLMRKRSEFYDIYVSFLAKVKTQFFSTIKTF